MKKVFKFLAFALLLNLFCSPVLQAQNKSEASTHQQREKLKVGVYLDLTGPTSVFGIPNRNGILLAAEEFNQTGSQKIELVFEDNWGLPENTRKAVAKLINQDKAHVVLGDVQSTNSLAAAPIAQEAKIPMISPSSTNPEVTKVGDYIFRTCFIDPLQGEAAAQFAFQTLRARRAAVIFHLGSNYSESLVRTFTETFTARGGKILTTESYASRDTDFRKQLARIRRAKPDVVYAPGFYGETAIIVKQARGAMRMNLPILGGDGWDVPDIFNLGGKALRNTFITNHFALDADSVEIRNFAARYEARFKTKPDSLAALAYDAMKVLIDAWRRAEMATGGEKLRNSIAQTKDFPGVTGKITLDRARNAVKPVVILQTDLANKTFRYKETIFPKP